MFSRAADRMKELGGTAVPIDFARLARAAQLLYEGPWVAERTAAIKDFLRASLNRFCRSPARSSPAGHDTPRPTHSKRSTELRSLLQLARAQWEKMDILLVPTAGRIYTVDEIAADPLQLNINLGYYTNFANLMDLCRPCGSERDAAQRLAVRGHAGGAHRH